MNKCWFIDKSSFARYEALLATGEKPEIARETIEEIRANADKWAKSGYATANLAVHDTTAIININGVLLSSASMIDNYMAEVFGESFTTYGGLMAQIQAAESNPFVESILFAVNTPGGHVEGLDEVAMAIATSPKPTKALVSYMAASAGYYLASQAGEVIASSITSSVGSIGTIISLVDDTEFFEKMGVKFYSISSSNAPNKAPEPHSDEFKQTIQNRVDSLEAIFIQRVSEGRSRASGKDITEEMVKQDFGRGGLILAREAMAAGMIDAINDNTLKKPMEAEMSEKENAHAMESAKADAMASGVNKERARVMSLLPWLDTDKGAICEAISNGSEMTPELMQNLSETAAETAKANAIAEAEKAALAAIESDVAPEVTETVNKVDVSEEQRAEDDFFAKAMAKSKIK